MKHMTSNEAPIRTPDKTEAEEIEAVEGVTTVHVVNTDDNELAKYKIECFDDVSRRIIDDIEQTAPVSVSSLHVNENHRLVLTGEQYNRGTVQEFVDLIEQEYNLPGGPVVDGNENLRGYLYDCGEMEVFVNELTGKVEFSDGVEVILESDDMSLVTERLTTLTEQSVRTDN